MNLLYWNLKSNNNLELIIADCIQENSIDIAIFSEYENINFDILKRKLSDSFCLLESFGGCKKVKILYRNTISLTLIREQHRYLLAKLNLENKKYIIVGVHLPSNTCGSNSSDRKHIIRNIINDISDAEKDNIESSIVIGDMNASPFDAEMIEKDSFNSVLFKNIINSQEVVTYLECKYRRFYNPIIEYINETNENYGSFYYSSGNYCLYWYCFDQILVRKNLANQIHTFKYLKKIKQQDLIKKKKPNKKISDHLPLLVNINI
ncbi:MAG: hypothetical protein J1F31_01905 [Erysipelotrichales bacterium]|nr:hypothetical protein [Erysipelotrichales bacterium]